MADNAPITPASSATTASGPIGSREDLRAAGRRLRERVARTAQSRWQPAADRPDPIDLLNTSNATRLPELVPVRNGRMMQSPFTFYRGAPLVMASDLSVTPTTGVTVQICGDAHLMNFGTFATPERNLIFDLNDFDETHTGPWEWDVKRLVASVVVAARTAGLGNGAGADAVRRCSAAYRGRMAALAQLSAFEVWHARIDVGAIAAAAPDRQTRAAVDKTVVKARRSSSLAALSKLTEVRDDKRVIVEDPPLVVRATGAQVEEARESARAYRATLTPDLRLLLDRYEFIDAALKVVGVGSVGTRCFVVLLASPVDLDPLFLQVKEAQPSVLSAFVGRSPFHNQGERVVAGQRIMQAASDAFLGWAPMSGLTSMSASSAT